MCLPVLIKKQMDAVIEAGGIASGNEQVLAKNRLVVVYPKDDPDGAEPRPCRPRFTWESREIWAEIVSEAGARKAGKGKLLPGSTYCQSWH
jgi:ABC-type molybdate transport system substrate-binding protein